MSDVLALAECRPDAAELVGGKAVGLGRLVRESLQVPPGFVVTTAAYRAWLHDAGLESELETIIAAATRDAGGAWGAIRELFAATPLPEELATAVTAAYAALGEDVPVAVRSSATAEDTAEASFAGQQETYLWIVGADAVLDHVRECWASLFTPQAMSYRARLAIPTADVAMAVVIQQMVDAAAAGVMITLDPLTGDPSQVAIEGAFGLGVPVVGGEITPDRFTVDKVTRKLRTRTIAHKPFADRFDRERGGVQRVDLDGDSGEAPCLTDDEALALAEVGVNAERALGGAQDIEWAVGPGVDGTRTLHFVQARPETVWRNRKRELPARGGAMNGIVALWGGRTDDRTREHAPS